MALEKNLELWAVIENDTIMAVGPLPYFAVDNTTGQKVQVRGQYDPYDAAHEADLATKFNLFAVYDEDRRIGDFDPDLEYETEPTDYINSDGNPVRRHHYAIQNEIRPLLVEKINTKAERERIRIAASFGGQMREYLETEQEVKSFMAKTPEERQNASPDEWPYLKAGIGNDIVAGGGVAMSLEDVAVLAMERAVQWRTMLASIRQQRKDALGRIELATDDATALDVYYRAFSGQNSAVYGSYESRNFI